jgi:HSP90 family molecular chaperone
MKAVPFKKLNEEARNQLVSDLEELIQRVKNDEIRLFAAVTADHDDAIAAYHARLQKASGLEVIGMVERLNDYLKDIFYGE